MDLPSSSQQFSQIAHAAGIEGILYKSSRRDGRNCLAIFPENFENSPSWVELEGPLPVNLKHGRLDSSTWQELC